MRWRHASERELRQVPLEPDAVQQVASLPLAPDAVLSRDDLQTLNEVRAMYRKLPQERLQAICRTPPRGWSGFSPCWRSRTISGRWPGGP